MRIPAYKSIAFAAMLCPLCMIGCGGSSGHPQAGARSGQPLAASTQPAGPVNVVIPPMAWHKALAVYAARDGQGQLRYGYLDEMGKIAIKPQFAQARGFAGDLAAVQPTADGPWGFIDILGKLVIPAQYIEVSDYSEEKAAVATLQDGQRRYGYLGSGGKTVVPFIYASAAPYSDNLARVTLPDSTDVIYLDHNGKQVLRVRNATARDFHQDLAAMCENGKWGFIDRKGEWRIQPQFDEVSDLRNDYALARQRDHWGLIDRKGRWVIQPLYTSLDLPSDGLLAFTKAGASGAKVGYIDMKGRVVIRPSFDTAMPFSEGFAAIAVAVGTERTLHWAYIDRKGNAVTLLQYVTASPFHNAHATVSTSDGQWGMINYRGRWILGPLPLAE